MDDDPEAIDVSLIDGFSVGFSDEERLVAVLLATLNGEAVNVAMTADAAIQLGEDLIKAGARLQDLKARDH